MSEKTRYLLKFLAIVLIIYGGIKLLFGLKSVWLTIRYLFISSVDPFWMILYYSSLTIFLSVVLPIGAIYGGVGLLKQKKWGWILSIIVSLIIFTLSCAGTINFIIASYHYRNILIPPIPEGAHRIYVSMIPTYISVLVSFVFIIVLRCKSIKNIFFQMD